MACVLIKFCVFSLQEVVPMYSGYESIKCHCQGLGGAGSSQKDRPRGAWPGSTLQMKTGSDCAEVA